MQKTAMEVKVFARLEELGITEEMTWQHRDKGGRSAIIGTYRILMYRMAADEETEAAEARTKKTEKCSPLHQPSLSPSADDSAVTTNESHGASVREHDPPVASPTASSPTRDSKLRHKFNFSFLPRKKRTKGREKGSRTCVIL